MVHWDNGFESIKYQPIIRVCFIWKWTFVILYHGFKILLLQWNTCLNLFTYDFVHSYLFLESSKISYSLLNMFHLFWYWLPCNKRISSQLDNVFSNIQYGHNPIWSIHTHCFPFFCFLSIYKSSYTFIAYPGYWVIISSSQFHHVPLL